MLLQLGLKKRLLLKKGCSQRYVDIGVADRQWMSGQIEAWEFVISLWRTSDLSLTLPYANWSYAPEDVQDAAWKEDFALSPMNISSI